MRIERLVLNDLKAFHFRSDCALEVDFTSDIQLVMGPNGVGKSRYISQLIPHPSPSPKNTFTDQGYRQLTITHQGSTYVLENDYSRKDGTHRFYVTNEEYDNHNLNESGKGNVQKELIDRYFGLNKEKLQLLHGEISITSMAEGNREVLLNKLAPMDLWLMIEKYKKVNRAIRSHKTELVYLTGRESELLGKVMSEENLLLLSDQKEELNQTIIKIIGEKGGITEKQNRVSRELNALGNLPSTSDLQGIYSKLIASLNSLDRKEDSSSLNEEYYRKTISSLEAEKLKCNGDAISIYEDIRKIEATLEKTSTARLEEKTSRLEGLKHSLTALGPIPSDPLTPHEVTSLRSVMSDIEGVVEVLADLPVPLITRNDYKELEKTFSQYQADRYRCQVELDTLQTKAEDLLTQLNRGADVRTIEPCAKNACPLFSFAVTAREAREKDYNLTVSTINQTKATIDKLDNTHEDKKETVYGLREAMSKLDLLSSLVGKASALGRYFTSELMTILTNNPHRLLSIIGHDIDTAAAAQKACVLQKEIDTLSAELSANESISEDYRGLLIHEVEKKTSQASTLISRIDVITKEVSALRTELSQLSLYIGLKDQIEKTERDLADAKSRDTLYAELGELTQKSAKLERNASDCTTELGIINTQLAEQDRIKAQYELEVKRRKLEVEQTISEMEDVAKALKDIPENATKEWLSKIVQQVNYYLSLIWNYRFEVLYDTQGPLSYRFPKIVKDVGSDDISESSKGEKKMIDLAFSLALRDSLGMSEYPLFLDEPGEGFDFTHTGKIVDLVQWLAENHKASQIILVNHQAAVSGGLSNIQVFVISSENIIVPEVYNEGIILN